MGLPCGERGFISSCQPVVRLLDVRICVSATLSPCLYQDPREERTEWSKIERWTRNKGRKKGE